MYLTVAQQNFISAAELWRTQRISQLPTGRDDFRHFFRGQDLFLFNREGFKGFLEKYYTPEN